jgi:hypothetical protein
MTNEMTSEVFKTLDDAQLADIVGAGYGTECAKGAAGGFFGGLRAGPLGAVVGGTLGCVGGIFAHLIDRVSNKK